MSNKDFLKIQKTAKVSTFGKSDAKVAWVVLHGYGQLAQFFIRKLKCLNENSNFIIAPEGLHRFYLNGTSGRVGASWMTKEERLSDIDDYVDYLDQVYDHYHLNQYEKLVLLGFSQGTATSARWMEFGKIKPNVYVHWAGVFPPDLEFNPSRNYLSKSKNYFIVGDEDPYFNSQKIDFELNKFKGQNIEIEKILFQGNHNLDSSVLMELENKLLEI